MQIGEAVHAAAVVVCGRNGLQHGSQVVRRDAAQAHQAQVVGDQRLAGRQACRSGLDGVGDAGQFVEVGHAVDVTGLAGAHDVVEQRQVLGVGGRQANVSTDGRVLRCCGVFGWGRIGRGVSCVGVGVVGFGQDAVVGVDDGLHFGGGVGTITVVGVAQGVVAPLLVVDGAVDGGQVASRDAGDARVGVVVGRRRAGAGFCVSGNVVDGCGVRANCARHQGLRADQGVELGGVVGRHQRRLHGGQVVGGHPADAQALQLAQAGVAVHDVLHRVGQGLQFGDAVDGGGIGGHAVAAGGVEHVAQQALFFWRVHAVHANGRVLRLGWVD